MSPVLFTLTGLTGRRAREQRIVPFATFEASPHAWWSLAAASVSGILLTLVGWPILGAPAVLVGLLGGAAVAAAMNVRSRRGTQRLWVVTQMDRRRSSAGTFFLCGMQVDPDQAELVLFSKSTVPAPTKRWVAPPGTEAPPAPVEARAVKELAAW